jgi:hypothetical protein
MSTLVLETPIADIGEITTIRFCGVNFTLETLEDYEFVQLFDAVIDHGSDLVERASTWPMHIYADRKEAHKKELAENARLIVLMDAEAGRRNSLPASTGPALCSECIQLSLPLDPSELCDDCLEVCNDYEQDRYIEPDFIAA